MGMNLWQNYEVTSVKDEMDELYEKGLTYIQRSQFVSGKYQAEELKKQGLGNLNALMGEV